MKLIKNITLATVLCLSGLSAHTLWVTSMESFTHKPGHTTVGLGWGHSLPFDDILNGPAKVIVEEFSITSPNKEKTLLDIPKMKPTEPTKKAKDFEVYDAQLGLQKIALKKDSTKGTYLIQAKTKPTFYTRYVDNKDRKRMKLKPKNEVKGIKKLLFSVKFEVQANTYLTLDKWTEQKATGKGLEIIPKSDLSNLKVGDMVKFEVLLHGKPLDSYTKIGQGHAFISASSNAFGAGKGFSLMAGVEKGIAKFEVQSIGQWRVMVNHSQIVTKDGPLKDLYGKVDSVVYSSPLTFHVK